MRVDFCIRPSLDMVNKGEYYDNMDKWKELCTSINDLKARISTEAEYEFGLVQILKYLLGWKNLQEQVEAEIGNRQKLRPDIILKDDANREQIIIELKRPSSSGEGSTQISSYLKIFKVKFGLLIDESISVFYNEPSEEPIKLITIPFKEDDENGEELAQVLDAANYSEEKMEDYCLKMKKKLQIDKDAEKIVEILISPEGKKIIEMVLKNAEQLASYNSRSIEKAVERIKIERIEKKIVPAPLRNLLPNHHGQKTVGIVTDGAEFNLLNGEVSKIVGVKPISLTIEGEEYDVYSWQNVAAIVLEKAWKKSPKSLDNNISISKDTTRLRVAKNVGESGYYYEGNKSAIELIRIMRDVARKAEIHDITIELR